MSDIVPTIVPNLSKGKPPGSGRRLGLLVALGALALSLGGCQSTKSVRVKDTSRTFDTVVIDAGHGGSDTGTRSRWAGLEKNATLGVAQRLQPKLQAAGFKTVMTRSRDVFIELNERARISNRQDNAIFLSIHFNEAGARRIRGTETYYKSGASVGLASKIQSKVSSLPGNSSRGVKTANFRVLRLNEYPAVLVECGFFSNPKEGSRCCQPSFQDRIAGAIAAGILEQRGGPLNATAAAQ